MKLSSILIVLAIIVATQSLPADAGKKKPKKLIPCLLNKGVSRCVDLPLAKAQLPKKYRKRKAKFCPYHICGPSYVEAEECPTTPTQLKANALCKARRVRVRVWMCRKNAKPIRVGYPYGCRKNKCQYTVFLCPCSKRRVRQTKYEHKKDYTPEC